MPRRRTRSRRTTRRLHRTRRHRQRGGVRKDLTEWTNIVKREWSALDKTIGLGYSIPEKLKRDELTLTAQNAPALPRLTGASEAFGDASPTAQTLLAAAASMVEQLGAETFSSPQTFKDNITALQSGPSGQDYSRLLTFMSELEAHLRSEQVINLTDEEIYPLYIWYAVANYDIQTTEDALVPILSEEPAMSVTEPTPAPSPIAE